MSYVAVKLEKLSKQYKIGVANYRHDTLRDHVTEGLKLLFQRNGHSVTPDRDKFWALKDVSFEINKGDVVGIIGRNGAGKSTLLKILSRITEPTSGRAEIRGRVASLLEVGTGFHGELTGRENIYLNGAILGMKSAEIKRKFDEIVAFSEIEKFIDTPVKRYSSGMYVRLAFAVAAHLEPEILIVDEVLAVGDAGFQNKCLGKMDGVAKDGRTVLFVSHNMAAVEHLCKKVFMLKDGRVEFSGTTKQGVQFYLRSYSENHRVKSHNIDLTKADRDPRSRPALLRLELLSGGDEPLTGELPIGAPLKARIHFRLQDPTAKFDATLEFDNLLGQRVFAAKSVYQSDLPAAESDGDYVFTCEIASLPLIPGEYKINVAIYIHNHGEDWVEDAARVVIIESDYYGSGTVPENGLIVLPQRWALQRL